MIATADAMTKAANLCTAFFLTGTGGSNLQRTIGITAPLCPGALAEPAHASFHTTWTGLYETAPIRTLLQKNVDFRRRPITFPCSKVGRCQSRIEAEPRRAIGTEDRVRLGPAVGSHRELLHPDADFRDAAAFLNVG